MYLRRIQSGNGAFFVIRESVWLEDHWGYRDLAELGPDPGEFIELPGGNGFYFKAELEQALEQQGVVWSTEELEALFLPFLPPHIQRIIESFGGAAPKPGGNWRELGPEQLRERQRKVHSFDLRRLHYLRCGRVDIGRLHGRAWKFVNILLDKGRDEIENLFDSMEPALRPHEIRPYIYTALDLQSYFGHHLLRNQPAALDPEKVDNYFLESICSLNRDQAFFRGIPDHREQQLHPFLVKYLIRYFDHDYQYSRLHDEAMRQFMWQRQFRRPAGHRNRLSLEEACRHLGISRRQFDAMESKDLSRCYRSLAMKSHPDKGGDHEAFIHATEAYERLLICKRSGKGT